MPRGSLIEFTPCNLKRKSRCRFAVDSADRNIWDNQKSQDLGWGPIFSPGRGSSEILPPRYPVAGFRVCWRHRRIASSRNSASADSVCQALENWALSLRGRRSGGRSSKRICIGSRTPSPKTIASCVRMLGRAANIPRAASGRAVAINRWSR